MAVEQLQKFKSLVELWIAFFEPEFILSFFVTNNCIRYNQSTGSQDECFVPFCRP